MEFANIEILLPEISEAGYDDVWSHAGSTALFEQYDDAVAISVGDEAANDAWFDNVYPPLG